MLSAALMSVVVASATGNLWTWAVSRHPDGGGAGHGPRGAVHPLQGGPGHQRRGDQYLLGGHHQLPIGQVPAEQFGLPEQLGHLRPPGPSRCWRGCPSLAASCSRRNLFTYAMFVLLVVVHMALFYTRWGLRTRAVGEHPKAADTLGINVFRTRYVAVLLSGMMAGLGGAYFTLGSVGRFDEVMTAGRGFISLAAMIFGNWKPFGAFGASLIFGFADALQGRLAILRVPIPSQFLLMAPYIATMIALAGLVGRVTPPAADGEPYEK